MVILCHEKALFIEMKRFFFSVLTDHVLTPAGVLIVREFSNPKIPDKYGDAQTLLARLVSKHQEGVHASLNAANIETDVSKFQLNDSWSKGVCGFLTSWEHKVMDLDAFRLPMIHGNV